MKYHDQDILTEYRARELPFMYQLNSISIPKDFDFYKDMENDFIEAIASSSPKTLSFFLEEFETKDYWGHTEKYLYPYLAEVAETMIKIRSKEIIPVLNSMLNHNRQTYERLNRTIIEAVGQYIDLNKGDDKYLITEQMKLEYKSKLLNDIRFDKSKHIVSLSILLNNRMGFITNIFNISIKSKDSEISNVIAQINEYYDSITSINDSK